jgi:hypothetical protein
MTGAIGTNDLSHTFAQKTGSATNVQDTLTVGKSKLLDRLGTLRDDILREVQRFKLPRGVFGEFESTHGCLKVQSYPLNFAIILPSAVPTSHHEGQVPGVAGKRSCGR